MYHYIYHYRDDSEYIPRNDPLNKTGKNPEILTDLTKRQVLQEYHKRKKTLKGGDVLQMKATNNILFEL